MVGEFDKVGPEAFYEVVEKSLTHKVLIDDSPNSAQKSYADNRKRDLEFMVGALVYLNISHMKEVMRFGEKGKLSPSI